MSKDIDIVVVAGSMSPVGSRDKMFTSAIDGYEVYIKLGNKKYKLTNKELEQFKLEE